MNSASRHEFEAAPPYDLEYILERDGHFLEELARPGIVLTRERLSEIEDATGEDLASVVEEAEAEGIPWPSAETGMAVVEGGHIERHIENERSDEEFALAVISGGGGAFNNFSVHLQSLPIRPEEARSPGELFRLHPSMLEVTYGTKPYLWRAHMVAKDFMEALHHEVAVIGQGGMSDWKQRVTQGAVDPEHNPRDAALLRGSRIAYVLLSNLMRTDDLELQYRLLGMDNAPEITDPERELWT